MAKDKVGTVLTEEKPQAQTVPTPAPAAPAAEASTEPAPVPASAETPKYTKCWLIDHPGFGSLRVFADTKAEAIEAYRGVRCPETADEHVLPKLIVRELKFVPAETEKDKPGGWVKPTKNKTKRPL